ncbi:MAG: hypothetical protein ACI94Y_000715 [Maribacter sp.]|jgi:hypothetical protein
MQPNVIVIEGPLDAQNIIHHIGNSKLTPPVAMLMYNPKQPSQAAYFPFARFSPEWQAIKWGIKNDVPIQFMDLPQSIHFTLDEQEKNEQQIAFVDQKKPEETKDKEVINDPLGYMARLAGYDDGERWWEVTFEQREGHTATFDAVQELMTALREELAKNETPRTLLREAHMRKIIRKAQKEHEKVAIVCGAWHGPVLEDMKKFKATDDNKLLRGIKKTSTKATWVPWTYDRLAVSSGYGAGVVSPAWYDMLFSNRKAVVIRWMTKVARLFRGEDLDASSAHVIEAVRLAETLASLRGLSVPGMNELYEAAVTIFCNGYDSMMELVEKKLIIGDRMGKVPDEIPVIPLQQDLEKQIKSCRMTKYKNSLEPEERELDLRQNTQLNTSRLLHRMNIIGIPWGKVKDTRRNYFGRTQGDFKETWKLRWRPDFAINIIEAGMWGNTVEKASANVIIHKATEAAELPVITQLVSQSIKANLPEVMDVLMRIFQNAAAITQDIAHLMQAIPKLVEAIRYANTRQADLGSLQKQLDQIIPRVCIGLPNACMSLNEEAANDLFSLIAQTDYQIAIIENEGHKKNWLIALEKIATNTTINGMLQGAATRILYDKKHISAESSRQRMDLALSKGNNPLDAALWIAGFLHGSGLVLIHDPSLWNVLDKWIDSVPFDTFRDILPVLRRTFSRFPNAEKEQMLKLTKKGQINILSQTEEEDFNWDEQKLEKVMPVLKLLLGLS